MGDHPGGVLRLQVGDTRQLLVRRLLVRRLLACRRRPGQHVEQRRTSIDPVDREERVGDLRVGGGTVDERADRAVARRDPGQQVRHHDVVDAAADAGEHGVPHAVPRQRERIAQSGRELAGVIPGRRRFPIRPRPAGVHHERAAPVTGGRMPRDGELYRFERRGLLRKRIHRHLDGGALPAARTGLVRGGHPEGATGRPLDGRRVRRPGRAAAPSSKRLGRPARP